MGVAADSSVSEWGAGWRREERDGDGERERTRVFGCAPDVSLVASDEHDLLLDVRELRPARVPLLHLPADTRTHSTSTTFYVWWCIIRIFVIKCVYQKCSTFWHRSKNHFWRVNIEVKMLQAKLMFWTCRDGRQNRRAEVRHEGGGRGGGIGLHVRMKNVL